MTKLPELVDHSRLAVERDDGGSENGPFVTFAIIALRERRLLLLVVLVATIIAAILIIRAPARYDSTASFMPERHKEASVASALAAQFNVAADVTGGSDSPEFYTDLLTSREILSSVLDSVRVLPSDRQSPPVRLLDFFVPGQKDTLRQRAMAIDTLKDAISTTFSRKTGVVTLSVSAKRPALAQAIAQRLIDELSRFNLDVRQSQASAERRFTQSRLVEVTAALRHAEDQLQGFLQQNRSATSPELAFEKDRLTREVALRQQLYTTLNQSYEQARIDEVRDTPILTLIEHPTFPPRPEPRHVIRRLAMVVVSAALFAFAIAFVKDRFKSLEQRNAPGRRQLVDLWHGAKRDLFGLRRRPSRD